MNMPGWRHRDLVSSFVLCLGFFALYNWLGTAVVAASPNFDFFGADSDDWFDLKREAEHRHPLTPLIIQPFVAVIRLMVAEGPHQAVIMNAIFGAIAVVLAYHVFRRVVLGWLAANLLALVFGLGMSELVAASVPESYTISACTINATYLLFLHSLNRGRVNVLAWAATAVLSLGATLSTVPQNAVTFVAALRAEGRGGQLSRAGAVAIVVVASVVVLNQVQMSLLNTRNLYTAAHVQEEIIDIKDNVFVTAERPEDRPIDENFKLRVVNFPRELAVNLFLLDFVGARVGRTPKAGDGDRTKLEYFGYSLRFGTTGLVAAGLWLTVWGAGVFANVREFLRGSSKTHRALLVSLLVILGGNTLMLAVYNPVEMFLYTPLTVFPILLLGVSPGLLAQPRWQASWLLLAVLMCANNVAVILGMIR